MQRRQEYRLFKVRDHKTKKSWHYSLPRDSQTLSSINYSMWSIKDGKSFKIDERVEEEDKDSDEAFEQEFHL